MRQIELANQNVSFASGKREKYPEGQQSTVSSLLDVNINFCD